MTLLERLALAAASLHSDKKRKGFPLLMIIILVALFVGLQSGCAMSLLKIMIPTATTLNNGWMRSMIGENEVNLASAPTEQEERYYSPAALGFRESKFCYNDVICISMPFPIISNSENLGYLECSSILRYSLEYRV